MGIIASLAASPVANAVIEDEERRLMKQLRMENEGLKQLGEAETSRLGQSELEVIKRLSKEIHDTQSKSPDRSRFREGHTQVEDVEKIYLTGTYKSKYKLMTAENSSQKTQTTQTTPSQSETEARKTRSAYPNVRIRSTSHRVYGQHGTPRISKGQAYISTGTPWHRSRSGSVKPQSSNSSEYSGNINPKRFFTKVSSDLSNKNDTSNSSQFSNSIKNFFNFENSSSKKSLTDSEKSKNISATQKHHVSQILRMNPNIKKSHFMFNSLSNFKTIK